MPIPFDEYDYLTWNDMERSPYVIWTSAEKEWNKDFERRLLNKALERYAHYLIYKEKHPDAPDKTPDRYRLPG